MNLKVKESLPFASAYLPANITSLEELFSILKRNTSYKDDPPGIELLQSMPALFNNNYHGRPGAGDCDCLSITMAACCEVCGFHWSFVLAGNGKNATHVFVEASDYYGKYYICDLTEPFNVLRPYKKYQVLK